MFEDDLTRHIDQSAIMRDDRQWLNMVLTVRFYLFPDDVGEMRAGMADCIDDYWSLASPYLTYYSRIGVNDRPIQPGDVADFRRHLIDAKPNDAPSGLLARTLGVDQAMSFAVDAKSARNWQIEAGRENDMRRGVSSFTASFPLGFFAFSGHDLSEFFDRCASRLSPFYGYCGASYGRIPSFIENEYQGPDVFRLAWNMPELEVDYLTNNFIHQGIRPASWLMALGPEEITKIGGLDAIRAALPEEDGFRVLSHNHGVTLRAGNSPMPRRYLFGTWDQFLADDPDPSAYTNENAADAFAQNFGEDALAVAQKMQQGFIPDIPKAPPEDFPLRYRLAALTKPLRSPDPYQLHNDFYGSPYFDKARTLQYYERFDP